jgi:uracil permease
MQQPYYSKTTNLVLSSVVFIIGISGAFSLGTTKLEGVSLATLVGLALSILLHFLENLFNL